MLHLQEELVESIQKKMDKLKEEKKELTNELEETESLGKEVQTRGLHGGHWRGNMPLHRDKISLQGDNMLNLGLFNCYHTEVESLSTGEE